jgi:hypothetical protein
MLVLVGINLGRNLAHTTASYNKWDKEPCSSAKHLVGVNNRDEKEEGDKSHYRSQRRIISKQIEGYLVRRHF